ncbi:carboxymuconolactone decarboxylase family protein [uncultured Dechloromonas sp.]|uniref:carboxymuconolactone decarboxylase family protein n=1 Tax=uncultured Dechloromonas sp. TaxID=171719 RepID=UPI0025D4C4E3|nr:carboxymuconolactone decarboxylase family protein [uncultured Dechloromonas sp.]
MSLRLPYYDLSAEALQHFRAIGAYLEKSTLGSELIELVYLRISQINGCAFCLKKHSKALRDKGFPQDKLDMVAGWHASDAYSPRERAALNWAEALTAVSGTHAADADYAPLAAQFSAQEISDLTFAIANMNALNRLAIAMRQ